MTEWGLAGRETPVGQPHDIAGCYVELAWAVIRAGVEQYMQWRRCGYVHADGRVDREFYWSQWRDRHKKLTPSKHAIAMHALNDVVLDTAFMEDGLYFYLKILGHEKQYEWLRAEITARLVAETRARHRRSG